jgi:hypothetical protein
MISSLFSLFPILNFGTFELLSVFPVYVNIIMIIIHTFLFPCKYQITHIYIYIYIQCAPELLLITNLGSSFDFPPSGSLYTCTYTHKYTP